jgi:hypothetical protein
VLAFLVEAQAKEKAGKLISRELVTRQAQYIFICLRQAILNFPTRYARHVVGIADEHQAKQILTKAAHEFLVEMASFPSRITDPEWAEGRRNRWARPGRWPASSTGDRPGDQGRAEEGKTSSKTERISSSRKPAA